MPTFAQLHPQIVHFAVALLFVGVLFRWIALTGRALWTGPAATALLLAGTLAAVGAVKSGDDAHGPAERVPGARDAVVEHEDWGKRARNLFLFVAALEIGALVIRRRTPRVTKGLTIASAVIGLGAGFALYEAADHGGDVVYNYAGGVGIRSGDPADVNRLLLAGLYHSAQAARTRKDSVAAADLFAEMASRFPGDTTVRLLGAESLLRDKNDPRAALAALAGFEVPAANARLRLRHGFLQTDAFLAAGQRDSARAALERLARDLPENARVRERLAELQ